DQLGAHAAQPPALLLLEGGDPDRAQRLFVSVDIEIVKLIEQLARVAPIGLAFAVEHFGRHHKRLHSQFAQLAMKSVAKSARLLHQHHPVLASAQFPGQVNNRAATAFAAVDRPTATHPHHEHPDLKLDIERHVNHTRFGPKSLKDCRKMGHNVIFQSVLSHNPSRMAPPGAVLEAYMTPTAPLRNKFIVFATTPWISSRFPASLVRFASARSRTPAVMLFNASRGLSLSR